MTGKLPFFIETIEAMLNLCLTVCVNFDNSYQREIVRLEF